MKLYEVNGTYGSSKTPCTVFVAEKRDISEGVDVESLADVDFFTASSPICSVKDLEVAIEG